MGLIAPFMRYKLKPSQQIEGKKKHIGWLFLQGKPKQTVDRDTHTSTAEFQKQPPLLLLDLAFFSWQYFKKGFSFVTSRVDSIC